MADKHDHSLDVEAEPSDEIFDESDDLLEGFRDAVGRRIPNDVRVVPADDGFAVGYPDPLVMTRGGSSTSTTLWSIVQCDASTMTFKVIDTVTDREVSNFGAGLSVGGFRGRVSGDRAVYTYGTRPDGTKGRIGKQVHSARVLHEAIRRPAAELGWVERQPASAIVGLVFAWIGGVGGAVTLVVLGALFLSGRLS